MFSIQKAYPSKTHMALVELMKKIPPKSFWNHLKFVVSQNVDGLHRKSGIPASKISELHGNSNLEYCEKCERVYMRDMRCRIETNVRLHRTGRKCRMPGCNGFLKDSAINFGEYLHPQIYSKGEQNCTQADVCLAMGSSMRVSQLPELTA